MLLAFNIISVQENFMSALNKTNSRYCVICEFEEVGRMQGLLIISVGNCRDPALTSTSRLQIACTITKIFSLYERVYFVYISFHI